MYGLMKARCGDTAHKEARRLHYCGTCKTLGTLYGPSARMLLNHDAVFLGELLTALTPAEPASDTWARAYRSYNCFALPRAADDLPLPLRFAAAANILLTEFKLADQIADGGARHWRIAQRWLARPVRQASAQLQIWGFPLAELWALLPAQAAREADAQPNGAETLAYVAAPTATATALFFRCGARVAGLPDAVQAQMSDLGAAFGRLVYLLDALEDYAQDVQRKEFNAFRTAYGWTQPRLDAAQRTQAARAVNSQADAITLLLQELPLPTELRESFATRLWGNLRARLAKKRALPVLAQNGSAPVVAHKTASTCATHSRLTWRERWHKARAIGRNVAAQTSAQTAKLWHYPHYLASLMAVTLTALVWPQQAAQARSGRECLAFGFNLMFLGALAGLIVSRFKTKPRKHLHLAPLAMAAAPGGYGPNPSLPDGETVSDTAQEVQREAVRQVSGEPTPDTSAESKSSCCDCCDCSCECCDSCDGCGDCGCCSSCDGCNICGSCDGCGCHCGDCCNGCDCCGSCDCCGCDC